VIIIRTGGVIIKEFVLYSVEEISELLMVSQRTLYNYIKSGALKAIKIGKYWRIRYEDLQDFINYGTGDRYLQKSTGQYSAGN
jgi:excisionase family DNA binding protein